MTPDRIEKQTELNAPTDKVWQAVADSAQFGQWFGVKLEGPFKAGQKISGRITHPGYEHVVWNAVVQKIEPEKLFSFTWIPYGIDPKRDYSKETPSLVEFRLEKIPAGTRLYVSESGFDKVPADRRDEAYRMQEKGWAAQMENIARFVC
jgi:uncharacterized protein YndB with AHSA1/START domain